MRYVNGAALHFQSDPRRYLRGTAGRAQPDLLAVTDADLFGVVAIDFHETIRVVEQEDVVLALECLAMFDQYVLVPVVKSMTKYQHERILSPGGDSLRLSGDRYEFEFPFRGFVTKSEPREIAGAERTVCRARPLPAIVAGKVVVAGTAVKWHHFSYLVHDVGGRVILPLGAQGIRHVRYLPPGGYGPSLRLDNFLRQLDAP